MSMSCDNMSVRESVPEGDHQDRPLEHYLKGEAYRFAGGN
jgi:hypothetical protein